MKRFDLLLIFSLGVIAIASPAQAAWPHADGWRPMPALLVQATPGGTQAGLDANKAIVRRFVQEVHDEGKFDVFNELFAPDYVNHSAPAGANNRQAREQSIKAFRAGAPVLHVTIDDMIAEGDKVALRWTTRGTEHGSVRTPLGVTPPTERAIDIPGINIFRVVNGKIAEEWIVWDTPSWAQQLGLVARPPQPAK
jgi:steroid delta-isomerase-like uncharacterized protein